MFSWQSLSAIRRLMGCATLDSGQTCRIFLMTIFCSRRPPTLRLCLTGLVRLRRRTCTIHGALNIFKTPMKNSKTNRRSAPAFNFWYARASVRQTSLKL